MDIHVRTEKGQRALLGWEGPGNAVGVRERGDVPQTMLDEAVEFLTQPKLTRVAANAEDGLDGTEDRMLAGVDDAVVMRARLTELAGAVGLWPEVE